MNKPTDSEQLPEKIAGVRKLIFDWTNQEDLEARLRMLVVHLRGSTDVLPKSYWTDIIEDIYKERDVQRDQQRLAAALEALPRESNQGRISLMAGDTPSTRACYVYGHRDAVHEAKLALTAALGPDNLTEPRKDNSKTKEN